MRTKVVFAAAALVALAFVVKPVVAHHSFSAEFDATKPFKLSGPVTKVEWMNPHTFFYIDVTDEKTGKVTNWAMEMGSPNGLMRQGWTPQHDEDRRRRDRRGQHGEGWQPDGQRALGGAERHRSAAVRGIEPGHHSVNLASGRFQRVHS